MLLAQQRQVILFHKGKELKELKMTGRAFDICQVVYFTSFNQPLTPTMALFVIGRWFMCTSCLTLTLNLPLTYP